MPVMMTRSSFRRLAWLYSALLVAIVVAAGRGVPTLELVAWLPGSDKTCHFLLNGLLCLLVNLAWGSRDRARVLWQSLLLALIVTVEEVSQLAMDHRRFEWADLAADFAGIAVFGLLATIFLGSQLEGETMEKPRALRT